MEFLVEFEVGIPDGTTQAEVEHRQDAEGLAAAKLAAEGHLLRVWKRPVAGGGTKIVGLYRATNEGQLTELLEALPLFEWMQITVTPLEPHPNDPALLASQMSERQEPVMNSDLPEPRLTKVYRLEVTLGQPLDLGDVTQGRRRIIPLVGGVFTGPELSGTLLPGASADWQIVLPDGTAVGDIRYTLQTDAGDLLAVKSRSVRHGSPDVLARLGRGEQVDPSEYTFRTATQIETGSPHLDWLNKGVFVSVGARQNAGVIYETYLVG